MQPLTERNQKFKEKQFPNAHFLVQNKIGIGPMCNLAHITAKTDGAPTKPFRKTFSTVIIIRVLFH